jgi:hypothetical protein
VETATEKKGVTNPACHNPDAQAVHDEQTTTVAAALCRNLDTQAVYDELRAKLPALDDKVSLANFAVAQLGSAGTRVEHMLLAVQLVAEANIGNHRPAGDQASHFRNLVKKPITWWQRRDNSRPQPAGRAVPRHDDPDDWRNSPGFQAELNRRGRRLTHEELAGQGAQAPPQQRDESAPVLEGAAAVDAAQSVLATLQGKGSRGAGPAKLGEVLDIDDGDNGGSALSLEEATAAARVAQERAEQLKVDGEKRCANCGAVGHTAEEHEQYERELAEASNG